MSLDHTGNIQNEIIREEHDGLLNAKRVSIVSSATIYIVSDVNINPSLGSRATIGNVTLTDTPVLILASDVLRRSVLIRNISNTTIFIGGSTLVTTSIGTSLQRDDVLMMDNYDGDVYGVANATGHSVRFLAELD